MFRRDHYPRDRDRCLHHHLHHRHRDRQRAMTREELHSEIRYAIRLTERTARLYRRIQVVGYILAIVGGSAAISAIGKTVPDWLAMAGAALFVFVGAALLAIRPAEKVAQNEADARRYQALITKALTMGEIELEQALEEARLSDASEIETLRDVAFNDVAIECDRPDVAVPLRPIQRLLAMLA